MSRIRHRLIFGSLFFIILLFPIYTLAASVPPTPSIVGSSNGERTITVSGVVAGATVSLYKSGSFVTSQYTPNGGTVVFSRLILGNGYRAVQSISGINSLPSSVVSVEAATNNNTNSGSNTGSSGSSDSNSGSDSSSSVVDTGSSSSGSESSWNSDSSSDSNSDNDSSGSESSWNSDNNTSSSDANNSDSSNSTNDNSSDTDSNTDSNSSSHSNSNSDSDSDSVSDSGSGSSNDNDSETDTIGGLNIDQGTIPLQDQQIVIGFGTNSIVTGGTTQISLASGQMEVKVLEVSQAAREDIMNAAFRGNNSIYNDIKSKVFSLSCRKNGESEEIKQFEEPAAVMVNLKDLNLSQNDIAQLCGIGFIEHEGSIVPVKLGGIYNQVNKTFTFYTEKYSYYTVMKVNNFININLTIRNLLTLANGRFLKIDVPPMIINNRTYVPLRFIGEALGAKFTWNAASKTVTYYIDGKEVNLVIDMPTEGMDAPPTIVNGRTMVPVRYIAESYGAKVMWIPYEELVTIVK